MARERRRSWSTRAILFYCTLLLIVASIALSLSYFVCSLKVRSHDLQDNPTLRLGMKTENGVKDYVVLTQREVDESNWRNRVYCMVPSLYNDNQIKRLEAIADGWGQYCDVIKYFLSPLEDGEVPKYIVGPQTGFKVEVVVVPMQREKACVLKHRCRHIWEKVWRAWDYVARNDIEEAEWFLKVDADSYFIPSNLRKFIRERGWSPDDPHYFGHKVYVTKDMSIASGVCSAFSKYTIQELGKQLAVMPSQADPSISHIHQCIDRGGPGEERVTAACLAKAANGGIFVEGVIDDANREYVVPLGIPFSLTYKRKPSSTSWYWVDKPFDRGDKENCCSPYAWGFHGYKSSSRNRRMTEMLFNMELKHLIKKFQREEEDSEKWWHIWYILKLREGMAADPYFRFWRKKPDASTS